MRKKENKEYKSAAGDTDDNLKATSTAIDALEKGMGAKAFIQQATGSINKLITVASSVAGLDNSDRESLLAFLQGGESGDYQPSSGQIVGILKNMRDEMKKSLGSLVDDEETAVKGFAGLKKAKEKEIALATSVIESKTKRSGELAVSIVQNENAQKDATWNLAEAQKFAANLDAMCKEKAAEYEIRVKTRQEEIAAISQAIAVLNDDDALDVFKSAIDKPKVAFLQMGKKDIKNKALGMIKKFHSKNAALNLLAHTITSKLASNSGAVDFSSVLKMIDNMVTLLKQEQKDDEKHKTWCETEFDTSEDESKAVSSKIASLESSISEMKDEIASLGDKISELKSENAALDKSVASATEQRKAEHAEFTGKIQLNEEAIKLIFKAKNRLQKFYNPEQYVAPEEPKTVEFYQVQIHQHIQNDSSLDPPPETFEGEYKPKGQKSNSVMALMDMLTKDLEKDVAEAEHDEKVAQKDYAELLLDAQETKAANSKTITDKNKSKADLEGKKEDEKNNLIMANDQLTNLQSYVSDLHQSCDFILANFETRRAARDAERESLSSAKAVLKGASFN